MINKINAYDRISSAPKKRQCNAVDYFNFSGFQIAEPRQKSENPNIAYMDLVMTLFFARYLSNDDYDSTNYTPSLFHKTMERVNNNLRERFEKKNYSLMSNIDNVSMNERPNVKTDKQLYDEIEKRDLKRLKMSLSLLIDQPQETKITKIHELLYLENQETQYIPEHTKSLIFHQLASGKEIDIQEIINSINTPIITVALPKSIRIFNTEENGRKVMNFLAQTFEDKTLTIKDAMAIWFILTYEMEILLPDSKDEFFSFLNALNFRTSSKTEFKKSSYKDYVNKDIFIEDNRVLYKKFSTKLRKL